MVALRRAIIELIEQDYGNKEIREALKCSDGYVRCLRAEYNSVAPVRKPSLFRQPKMGTKSRAVYDFFVANPRATPEEAHRATGTNRGTCSKVRSRYLFYARPKCKPFRLNHVSLSELELIE